MSSFFTLEKATIAGLDYFTVKSPALGHRADISVYKPKGNHQNLPVVLLLHGVYGSHWAWSSKAEVHLTLQRLIDEGKIPPMLLAMPSDGLFQDGSGYLPHKKANYERWIVEDVPLLLKENYEEVSGYSPFFIAGLSMGGYGALRLGAKYPQLFKAFSGLSSITRFEQLGKFVENFDLLKASVLKEEEVLDVILEYKDTLRPFRFDCGSKDILFEANVALHKQLTAQGIKHDFYVYDGEHSWGYWQQHIVESLLFFAQC